MGYELYYDISEVMVDEPSNKNFHLHNHDSYEIYLFLEGDASYIVEGNTYSLEPYDIIIIRRYQMHRVFHNSTNKKYRRAVLMVSPEFFEKNNCAEYENEFKKASSEAGNKIDANTVRKSGLYDAFMRIKRYSNNYEKLNNPVVNATVTEILYLINEITTFKTADISNKQLRAVISYINNRYTENITLDGLEEKFFISKYHLCRIFKKATGHSIHSYITHKRITKVRELTADGMSLGDAALSAGFGDYSAFYRAYVKEFNTTPGKDMRE